MKFSLFSPLRLVVVLTMSSPPRSRSNMTTRHQARHLSNTSDEVSRETSPTSGYIETPTGTGIGTRLTRPQRNAGEKSKNTEIVEALEDIEARIAWFRSDFKVDPERTDEINDHYLEIEELCESVASELALKPELTSVTRHMMIRVSTLKSELEQVRNLHWSRQSDITPRTLRLDSDVISGRNDTVEVDLTVRPTLPGTPPTASSSLNQDIPHDIPQDDALTEFLNSFERPEKDDIDTRLAKQNEKIDTPC